MSSSTEETIAVSHATNDGKRQMKVYVNLFVQQVHAIDESTGTYVAFVEIGFRYDVCDYLDVQGPYLSDHKSGEARAVVYPEDMRMPFNIPNAASREVVSQAHFFRDVTKAKENPSSVAPCELYGDVSSVAESFVLQKPPPRGTLFKCESYSMNMTLAYNSVTRLEPFDELYLFVKVTTSDGRPGTEQMVFVYDETQTSLHGMTQPIGPFYPASTKPMVNQVKMAVDDDSVVWPRLYFSIRMKRRKTEAIVKYYGVPLLLLLLLVVVKPENSLDFVGLGSTLVLANIALLFVTNGVVMTFQEQAVILNTVVLVVSTVLLSQFHSYEGFSLASLLFGIGASATMLMLVVHWSVSTAYGRRVQQAIEQNDFTAIDTM